MSVSSANAGEDEEQAVSWNGARRRRLAGSPGGSRLPDARAPAAIPHDEPAVRERERELTTWTKVWDCLAAGKRRQAADLCAQRIKASERAFGRPKVLGPGAALGIAGTPGGGSGGQVRRAGSGEGAGLAEAPQQVHRPRSAAAMAATGLEERRRQEPAQGQGRRQGLDRAASKTSSIVFLGA